MIKQYVCTVDASAVQRRTRESRTGAVASGRMVWERVTDDEDDRHTYELGTQGPSSKLEVSLRKI